MKRLLALACACLSIGAVARGQTPAAKPAKQAPPAAAATPTIDQILSKYLEAEGGRAAWQKLTSRETTGTIDVPSMNLSGTVEIHEKAPDRLLGIVTINGASFRQAYDGTTAWTDDPQDGLRVLAGPELAESRRDADFFHPLNLRKLYAKLTVSGKEKIGERDAWVVEGALPEGGEPDRLYFDAQTGLTLRTISQHHGPDGVTEYQEDFEDYREVDGIKMPFTIHQKNGGTSMTVTITEVHHNVEVDDSLFAKPAAQ